MSRSIWKGPFLDSFFFKRKKSIKQHFKLWSRRSNIPNFLVGKTVQIHNGRMFRRILITREKVGYKFGDFSFTRNLPRKSKIKKIKK